MAECNRLESGRQGDPLAKGSNPLPSATCLTNKTWSQNLRRACRSSRSTRPWSIVSVHVDAGFFPAAATGR